METKSEEICQAVEENPENNSQEAPIFKLNDDCLIKIFNFLPIKDRIGLEKGIIFIIIKLILHNLFLALWRQIFITLKRYWSIPIKSKNIKSISAGSNYFEKTISMYSNTPDK